MKNFDTAGPAKMSRRDNIFLIQTLWALSETKLHQKGAGTYGSNLTESPQKYATQTI